MSPSESAIQSSYIAWLNLQYPEIAGVTASFANGGCRDPRYGARLKREGLKKGFPDVGVFYPSNPYHGLFIEFKSANGVLSSEQLTMAGKLTKQMYKCVICRSLEEAISTTKNYLNMM